MRKTLRIQLMTYYSLAFSGISIIVISIIKKWLLTGLNLAQILVLQSIYAITIVVLEIPTGAISDSMNRKTVLFAYLFLAMTGIGIYGWANSFIGYAIAEIVLGFSVTLYSGTASAFAYESLAAHKSEHLVKKVYGKQRSLMFVWAAVTYPLGALLSKIDLKISFVTGILVYLPAFILLLIAEEPPRTKAENVNKAITKAFRSLTTKMSVILYMSMVLLFGVLDKVFYWGLQIRLFSLNVDPVMIGLLISVANIVSAVGSRISHKLSGKEKLFFLLVATYIISGYVLYRYVILTVLVLTWLTMQFIRGCIIPFFNAEMQKDLSSEERATVPSMISTFANISYSGYGFLTGLLALSNETILFDTIIISGLIGAIIFVLLRKRLSYQQKRDL